MSMTENEATKLHVGIIGSGRKYPRSVGEYMDSIEELEQYRAIGTVSEFRENKNFLEFLYNAINPNDMEQYLAMYHASGRKGE